MARWLGEEPTLAEIQAEFAQWTIRRGTDDMCHAWPPLGHPGGHVRGEDPLDLRDMIIREIWHATGDVHQP